MSYEVVLGPDAAAKLKTVPGELSDRVQAALEELGRDPKKVGRKTVSPPYVPIGHIYQFHETYNEQRHYFTVFFLYDDDEKTLAVWDIVIDPRFSDVLSK
jgi:mRNA-degrading endonuclease RelE of RelBE toxin-antitoxin system